MKRFFLVVVVLASVILLAGTGEVGAASKAPRKAPATPTVITTVREKWVAWVDGVVVSDIEKTTSAETPAPYYTDYKKAAKRAAALKKKNETLVAQRDQTAQERTQALIERDEARWEVTRLQSRLDEALKKIQALESRVEELVGKNNRLMYGLFGTGVLSLCLLLWLVAALRGRRARASP